MELSKPKTRKGATRQEGKLAGWGEVALPAPNGSLCSRTGLLSSGQYAIHGGVKAQSLSLVDESPI
jgi:hypothetical protein